MPDKHVVLLSLHEEGRKNLASGAMSEQIDGDLQRSGGRLLSLHVTLGSSDVVAIVELTSDKLGGFVGMLATLLGQATVLRAYDEQEALAGRQAWDDDQADTGKLGP